MRQGKALRRKRRSGKISSKLSLLVSKEMTFLVTKHRMMPAI
jgi:hypothetical protein